MSLRKKAFIITMIIIVIAIPIIYYFTKVFFFDSVVAMEKKQLEDNMIVTSELINKRIELVDSINNDWAQWDDTYEFVNKFTDKYIEENLSYLSLKAIKVSQMLYFGSDKEFKYGVEYNLDTGVPVKISEKLINEIKRDGKILKLKGVNENIRGILVSDENPYIFAARPIYKSNFMGESRGVLITLKLITNSDIVDIQNTIKLPIRMEVFNSPKNSSEFSIAAAEIEKNSLDTYIKPVDKTLTQIYFSRADYHGKNAVIFRLEMKREIYLIGYKNQMVFFAATILLILLFYVVTLMLLNHFVFIPMNKLNILINTIPAAVYYKDIEKKYISVNKMFYELFGIKRKRVRELRDRDIMSLEIADKEEIIDNEIIKTKESRINMIANFKTEDGQNKWFSTSKAPMLDHKGRVIGVACITTDISNIKEMEEKLEINGARYSISNSVGIAIYPDDGISAEELLKNAGTAMQGAKETGKNRYMFYNKNLTQKIFEKIETEKNIRLALEKDEFLLYYQPQISFDGKKIFGAEALIRWNHPVIGFIPPYKFISIAEESNLIVPIGEWVLKMACKQAKEWSTKLSYPVKVSVNLSSVQLYQNNRDIIKVIMGLLNETQLPPHLLEVEITESVVMKDFDISCRILKELKNNGITIALDDFGTGYSSMVYLKNLPIDKIKIDQNFIRDLKEGSNDQVIVKTIVQLSKELGLSVIAEGVETREQLEILRKCNCQELQGYFFNRPVPAADFEEYFKSWDSIKDGYFDEMAGDVLEIK